MYILRYLTQQLGTRLALRSFNVHRLGSSINYVCGCQHQEPDFSVVYTKNGLRSKYIWSRSYTSQVSTNLKVVLERLKDRNVPQVEAPLESADFKKRILDLVTYYYDFENQTGQKPVETSMSIVDLYQIHVTGRYYGFIPQVPEHLSKSDSFKKLLETLPDHVDNISIGDQLDIYMGLLLLGVEETNLSMNHLFCSFYKADSMLGLSELAKIKLLFKQRSKVVIQFYTPDIQHLLNNNCIQNQEDCKNLAVFIQGGMANDEILVEICNQMLCFTAHSNLNDIDFILKILNALLSSNFEMGMISGTQNQYAILNQIMDELEPKIEILESGQIVDFFSGVRPNSLLFLRMNYSKIFKDMCARVVFCLEGVLREDLPLEEKAHYLHITTILYADNHNVLTSENIINKILHFITINSPGAKFTTLFYFVKILMGFGKFRRTSEVLNYLMTEILNILQSQPTFDVQIDGISILGCLEHLFSISPGTMNHLNYAFAPYITWYIQSGHACSSFHFRKMCKFAIPILGNNMPSIADERIRNQILSMRDYEHTMDKAYFYGIQCILVGTLLEYANRKSDYADSIIRLFTTTLQSQRLPTWSVPFLLGKLRFGTMHSSSFLDLKKAFADQVVVSQNQLGHFTSRYMLPFISEENANTLLRYSALAYFNGKFVEKEWSKVLFSLILMFFEMSRYPKDKLLLKKFSQQIFDEDFDNFPIFESYKILQALCSLGIYLDQYLQIVFSREYLAKLFEHLRGQKNIRSRNVYAVFERLNREVVLHRQKLNIPWILDSVVTFQNQPPLKVLLQETVEFNEVKRHLSEVLGEFSFLGNRVTAKYGIKIDFEIFLDSSNKPMSNKPRNQIRDIQKIAVIIGRKTHQEYLAEDPTAPSVYNTNMIKDLNALGYKTVLIQGHEWNSLMPEGRNHFLKENIFEKEMK